MYSPEDGEGEGIAFAGIPERFWIYSAEHKPVRSE